jgi:hypothetical protein
MLDAIDTIQEVVLFTLGVSILPQFLYFEISFLIREKNNKPKLYESVIVGFILGFAAVGFLSEAIGGEAGLAMIASSPMIIALFIITGLPVGVIYKLRKKSFFRLSKREKKSKIDEL